jgi:hypothetical protein
VIEKGMRLRINDAMDVVVLDICDGSVKLGVLHDDRETPPPTPQGLPAVRCSNDREHP